MVDLLVTTPKSEIANSKREADNVEQAGGHWFRVFNSRPKVGPGSKIFFVENGYIVGFGIIFEVAPLKGQGEECQTTGRLWTGNYIVRYNNWHWLENPVPHKGFQGYRYVQRNPTLAEKLGCF